MVSWNESLESNWSIDTHTNIRRCVGVLSAFHGVDASVRIIGRGVWVCVQHVITTP